ncbi:MAG TPA: NAD(P)/FAD-dependent oxidoreductase, partial [Steroidobacteraceae bacterium]|nr:NAD(P)/FAD-dependent oxidoreductase [Steroidobacteraceae bacterium]
MSLDSRGAAQNVLIIGAGPVGTLLAILLARAGRQVRVLERRADPRTDDPERGRSINLALAARGLLALERAGVLANILPDMVEMRGRRLHDLAGNGPLLPYGQHAGEVIHAISRARLNVALIEAAATSSDIDLRFGQCGIDVDPHSGVVQWRNETDRSVHQDSAGLVVAADGAGSAIRNALHDRELMQATEETLEHDYKELHIPATSTGGWALETHALHVWPRGGYMLIALPNPDGTFTATLFLPVRGMPGFDSFTAPDQARAFFAAQFPDALALIPDFDHQFMQHPQGKLATLYCWPWHVQRLLLIGDAAHAIVPFHGQGLNCGFEDCVLLADLLARSDNVDAACTQFERARRPNTDAIAA